MTVSTEIGFVVFIVSFFGIMIFIQSLSGYPPQLKILDKWDYVSFGVSVVGISGTCVIATGIPCAIAIVAYGVYTLINYVLVQSSLIKLMLIMPMSLALVYVISRLARGGG